MEFSFAWSPEYNLPSELKAMPILRLTSESVLPLLESAAKALRRSSESEDTVITGKIVQLRGEISDEGDDLEVPDNKMIVIERETEQGSLLLFVRLYLQKNIEMLAMLTEMGKPYQ